MVKLFYFGEIYGLGINQFVNSSHSSSIWLWTRKLQYLKVVQNEGNLQNVWIFNPSVHAIGESISYREHLDANLEGLPRDYESTISLINDKFGNVSIVEVETISIAVH